MLGEDPGDVECHVAVADDGDLPSFQRPGAFHVGVAVVPGHEIGAAEGTVELDAGNRKISVPDGARREDDRIIETPEIGQCQVPAVVDVAEETDVAAVQHLVQGVDDPLDPRVVGGDTVPDEAVRCRILVEKVDTDLEVASLDLVGLRQDVGGVDACRPGADDRDPQRTGRS